MRKLTKRLLGITAAALLLGGCAHSAKMIDEAGKVTRIHYSGGTFTTSGPIWFDRGGERCDGSYSSQLGRPLSWGAIFDLGRRLMIGTGASGAWHGAATMTCPSRRIFECEYVANDRGSGSGYCKDDAGGWYRAVFE